LEDGQKKRRRSSFEERGEVEKKVDWKRGRRWIYREKKGEEMVSMTCIYMLRGIELTNHSLLLP